MSFHAPIFDEEPGSGSTWRPLWSWSGPSPPRLLRLPEARTQNVGFRFEVFQREPALPIGNLTYKSQADLETGRRRFIWTENLAANCVLRDSISSTITGCVNSLLYSALVASSFSWRTGAILFIGRLTHPK